MASEATPRWTSPPGLPPEPGLPAELGLSPDLDPVDPAPAGRRALDPAATATPDLPAPVVPPLRQSLPAPPDPSVAATVEPAPATELIVCPECGLSAEVILNRRDSEDFCRACDYPLFWVPSRILLGRVDSDAASLRRLPGTLGRTTVASLECPHCEELNAVSAELCVRCGLSLHPVAASEPEPVPEPEPEPEPDPEPRSTWWAWLLIALAVVTVLVTVLYLALGTT